VTLLINIHKPASTLVGVTETDTQQANAGHWEALCSRIALPLVTLDFQCQPQNPTLNLSITVFLSLFALPLTYLS